MQSLDKSDCMTTKVLQSALSTVFSAMSFAQEVPTLMYVCCSNEQLQRHASTCAVNARIRCKSNVVRRLAPLVHKCSFRKRAQSDHS